MVGLCILPYMAASSLDISRVKKKFPQLCFGVIKWFRECKLKSAFPLWYLTIPPRDACRCWHQEHIQRVARPRWHFLCLWFTRYCYWLMELLSVWAHSVRFWGDVCARDEAEKLVHRYTVFPSAWGNSHLYYIIILQKCRQGICVRGRKSLSRKLIFT